LISADTDYRLSALPKPIIHGLGETIHDLPNADAAARLQQAPSPADVRLERSDRGLQRDTVQHLAAQAIGSNRQR
jgi:hypothetical protein